MVGAHRNDEQPRTFMPRKTIDSSPDGNPHALKHAGWRNRLLAPGSSGKWPVYAPTNQCDYGSDSNAWIAFDRAGDFVLDEEHLDVGPERLNCMRHHR
jgi:hypothetical protein